MEGNLMERKKHFKMYKIGKHWAVAGIVMVALLEGTSVKISASTGGEEKVSTEKVTEMTINNSEAENSEQSSSKIAESANVSNSLPKKVDKVSSDDGSVVDNSKQEDTTKTSQKSNENSAHLSTSDSTEVSNNLQNQNGSESVRENNTLNKSSQLESKPVKENISPVNPTNQSLKKEKVQYEKKVNVQNSSTTKLSKSHFIKSAAQTYTVNPETPKRVIDIKLDNLPEGGYYKTGSTREQVRSLVNGTFYLTGQELAPNTSWSINRIGADTSGLWYDLGKNQWVTGTALYIGIGDPVLANSRRPTVLKPVSNNFVNKPIQLKEKMKFQMTNVAYYVYDSYLDNKRATGAYYQGPFSVEVNRVAVDSKKVTWLEVVNDRWIRLTGFDISEIGLFQRMKTNQLNVIPEKKVKLTKFIDTQAYRLVYTASHDLSINGLENGSWILSGQILKKNDKVKILSIYLDDNYFAWYQIGENEWVTSDTTINILGSGSSKKYAAITKINGSNQIVTLDRPIVCKAESVCDYIFSDYENNYSLPIRTLNKKLSIEIWNIVINQKNQLWGEVSTNKWIRLSGNDIDDIHIIRVNATEFKFSEFDTPVLHINIPDIIIPEAKFNFSGIDIPNIKFSMPVIKIDIPNIDFDDFSKNKEWKNSMAGLKNTIEKLNISNQNLKNALSISEKGLNTANKGMQEMLAALYGGKYENGIIRTNEGVIIDLNTANKGMQEMLEALYGGKNNIGVIESFSRMILAVNVMNAGLVQANAGMNEMLGAMNGMIKAQSITANGINTVNKAFSSYDIAVKEMLCLHLNSENIEISNGEIAKNIKAENYLQSLYNAHKNAFTAFEISSGTLKSISNSLMKSAQAIDSVKFLIGSSLKIIGGAAATITGITGVTG